MAEPVSAAATPVEVNLANTATTTATGTAETTMSVDDNEPHAVYDADRIRSGLGGLEPCTGRCASFGQYFFTELQLSPPSEYDVGVEDLSTLKLFRELRRVDLSHHAVRDLTALQNLPFLKEVVCDYNKLSMGLSTCAAPFCREDEATGEHAWSEGDRNIGSMLEVASLSRNQIRELGDHSRHRFLARYNLSHNMLERLGTGLRGMSALLELNLAGNLIAQIQAGQLPTSLTCLDVSQNVLTDLTFASELERLRTLRVDGNEITNLGPLQTSRSLRYIAIRSNKISTLDQGGIVSLRGITTLCELSIDGNPVQDLDFARLRVIRRLPQLETLDGLAVSSTDRVRARVLVGSEVSSRQELWEQHVGHPPFQDTVPPFQDAELPDDDGDWEPGQDFM